MGNRVASGGGTTTVTATGAGEEDGRRRGRRWKALREEQLGSVPDWIFSNDGRHMSSVRLNLPQTMPPPPPTRRAHPPQSLPAPNPRPFCTAPSAPPHEGSAVAAPILPCPSSTPSTPPSPPRSFRAAPCRIRHGRTLQPNAGRQER
ncbi:unnamed protein product [Urochloa humidicola]